MVGQVLGHYRIESRIGEGQFAFVYRGRDIRLDRAVAVKVLKEKGLQGSPIWGRLLYEARIVSTLNHPNVCTLHDIGEEEDINFIVFELVEGRTLEAILESGPLPARVCLAYAIQIAEAMAHANGAGILHLDLKSSNVMVTAGGRVKVIDFGLAKIIREEQAQQHGNYASSALELGWLAGTLPYMAPELLHGEAPTTQTGVWSLGVILFEMLLGRLPFVGRTPFELAMDIMAGSNNPIPVELPLGLQGVVRRCLARDVRRRYCSAVEVLENLNSELTAFEVKAVICGRGSSENRLYRHRWLHSALNWLLLFFIRN